MRLGDAPVARGSPRGSLTSFFNSMTRRVGGSGGCNQLSGTYEVKGDWLSLGPATTTLMACAEGMDTEKAFLEVRLEARHLE
jgi:heat shock protein HslJ